MLLCSQYSPSGNFLDLNNGYSLYPKNVFRTACQNTTGDDGCSACAAGQCTACYTGLMLNASTGKVRWGTKPCRVAS